MKATRLSAAIAGAALSVGGLALAPVSGAAHAQSTSAGVCFKVVGVGHHYTVVAYPCPQQGIGRGVPRRKQSHAVQQAQVV